MYSETSKTTFYYLLSDMAAILVAYFLMSSQFDYEFLDHPWITILLVALMVIVAMLLDGYRGVDKHGYWMQLKSAWAMTTGILALFSLFLILGNNESLDDIAHLTYNFLAFFFIANCSLIYLGRVLVSTLTKRQKPVKKKVLLLTNFKQDQRLKDVLAANNYKIVAYVSKKDKADLDLPLLKTMTDIRDFFANNQVDEIFVSLDSKLDYFEVINYFRLLGVPTTVGLEGYSEYFVGDSVIKKLDDMPFVTTAINIVKYRQLFLKRIMDIAIGLVGLVLTGLVALLIAPIVKKQSPGPLFFKQKRVGHNGRVFEIYKFRSMYLDAEERKKELMAQNDLDTNLMFKMEGDPRIFPFGHKIRDWSIDELPQFINVLRGEMSVVGTRPPTLEEYRNYELHHFKRLAAKPGITGLWQVSGRSDITDFEEVVALDMKYIQNWSISQDIKIIAKTFAVVLKREGSR